MNTKPKLCQRIQRSWRNLSFRKRLILSITALHLLLMSALVTDVWFRQHRFLHQQGHHHAANLAQAMAASSSAWVMANDLAGLQEIVETVAAHTSVRYVMVIAPGGQVLAHDNPAYSGKYLADPISQKLLAHPKTLADLVRSHSLEDIAAPILVEQQLLAWARVGVDQSLIQRNLIRLAVQGILYTLLGTVIAYLMARLAAGWITRGLQRLGRSLQRVSTGERGFRLPAEYQDEISHISRGFNHMLDELESNEAQLRALATTDPLTGLANRRSFLSSLQHEIARTQRSSAHAGCVLMLDLDFFKRVNDTYGHAAGDSVLRHTALLMQDGSRQTDLCGRLGGEEFAILLPDTKLDAARQLAERLRESIARIPTKHEDLVISVTISIGITLLRPSDTKPDTPLARADKALYSAKNLGRNRVEVEA